MHTKRFISSFDRTHTRVHHTRKQDTHLHHCSHTFSRPSRLYSCRERSQAAPTLIHVLRGRAPQLLVVSRELFRASPPVYTPAQLSLAGRIDQMPPGMTACSSFAPLMFSRMPSTFWPEEKPGTSSYLTRRRSQSPSRTTPRRGRRHRPPAGRRRSRPATSSRRGPPRRPAW